ncbi:class I SAM-dependent methyltransferase [Mariprofundus erugo]|uniref:Class I SAM-dependent methyltransferase n=1 Tax=Mariprofundus erugo TaxID=2528639 RepID=A0A5R9GS29_9PROT|nr:methyltransferase domain-containing protein [Mariprofundus erugo]TLS69041.1 class I SAM-dependent methyltransferase [Mariprofundus erugo]
MPVHTIDLESEQDEINFDHADKQSYVFMTDDDAEWRQVTEKSLDEYIEYHDLQGYDELTRVVMQHFQNIAFKYMHLSAGDDARVLDVGCGVGRTLPLYARDIAGHSLYVGLDPIHVNVERDYHFLCAKAEDLARLTFAAPFNLVLFATSLDHVRDVRVALDAVKTVLADGGYMVFWLGLHDSSLVAETAGSQVLKKIFSCQGLLRRSLHLLKWLVTGLPALLLRCAARERSLRKRMPLDPFHFHYFLDDDIDRLLSGHGEIVERLRIPGTNSLFVVIRG